MRIPSKRARYSSAIVLALSLLVGCAPDGPQTGAAQVTSSPVALPTPSGTPSPADLYRFAVIGDYGSGWDSQKAVASRMCDWREKRSFDLVVTTGDNIYPDGSRAYFQERFFEPYRCLLNEDVRFKASLGNHDYVTRQGRDVLDEPAFGMPRRNYVHRDGGIRFVFADSNVLDREWLSRALAAEPTDRWTIVVFHHPVYSPGPARGSTPGYRPSLPRLFRDKGVDLVLNGHDHIYFASEPLRRIRYVVTGGAGASLYPCGDAWYVAKCRSVNHFVEVTATDARLTVRAIPASGPPFHKFTTTGR